MNILFVASDISLRPQHNKSERGDNALENALPKALKALGHRALVVAPYRETTVADVSVARRLVTVDVGTETHQVFEAKTQSGVEVVLLRGASDTAIDNKVFVEAVAGYIEARAEKFDAVHVLGAALEVATRRFRAESLRALVGTIAFSDDAQKHPAKVDANVRVPEVPAGIDYASWNPAIDPHLAQRYDFTDDLSLQKLRTIKSGAAQNLPVQRFGKAINKSALQHAVGWPQTQAPMLLVPANGVNETLLEALPTILRQDVQVLCLGWRTSEHWADGFREAEQTWPDRLRFVRDTKPNQETFTHRALAATDILLALENDTDLPTLAALKYGVLPIVSDYARATLVELGHDARSGSAIFVSGLQSEGLANACLRAIALFAQQDADSKTAALRTRLRLMREDHSWDLRARSYERAYR